METQYTSTTEATIDQFILRDLLDSEVVLVGGGEVVVTGI